MKEIYFTDVGEGLHEGEILQWYVSEGSHVEIDEPLVEIQTDKVAIEISSTVDGIVNKTYGDVGDKVIVGEVVVTIEQDGKKDTKKEIEKDIVEENHNPIADSFINTDSRIIEQKNTVGRENTKKRVKAAPSVRKYARELNVDLYQIVPSEAHGRITKKDVENAKNQHIPVQTTVERPRENKMIEKITGVKKQMYHNMEYALTTIPHTTAMYEWQVSELIALRETLNASLRTEMTFLPLFSKIVSVALKQYPIFNAVIHHELEEIHYNDHVHLGIAMATKKGLIVPVVKNTNEKTVEELYYDILDLKNKVHTNELKLADMQGATFTISSTGLKGGTYATPVITPPQVAILSLHAMVEKPVILRDRTIGIGTVMGASLSFDHRIIDGEAVGLFMDTIQKYVENPSTLIGKL